MKKKTFYRGKIGDHLYFIFTHTGEKSFPFLIEAISEKRAVSGVSGFSGIPDVDEDDIDICAKIVKMGLIIPDQMRP